MTGCLVHGFDPFRHEGMHEALALARREEPVFYHAGIEAWVVTRYADIVAIFRDVERFSARVALAPVAVEPAVIGPILKAGRYVAVASNADLDPPDHGRIRRIVMPLIGTRRLALLEPTIRRIIKEAIDRLPSNGRVELVDALTYEVPARVLFALLGLPDDDVAKVKGWAEHFISFVFGRPTQGEQVAAANGLVAWRKYCVELVSRRQREPGDDLVSDLVRAHQADPTSMSIAEIEGYIQGLLVAGHETTTHQATNSIRLLLLDPTKWSSLAADPTLAKSAVEECLRMESSVVAWRRRALVDVEVGGVTIPAGATVLLSLASGNRDAAAFLDPDDFEIARKPDRPHLSFGHGAHFCIGAPLARLELCCLLEELPRRLPKMRLVDRAARYPETISFRGPLELWVEVG